MKIIVEKITDIPGRQSSYYFPDNSKQYKIQLPGGETAGCRVSIQIRHAKFPKQTAVASTAFIQFEISSSSLA